jgi:ADP-ribosylglycohydrolase
VALAAAIATGVGGADRAAMVAAAEVAVAPLADAAPVAAILGRTRAGSPATEWVAEGDGALRTLATAFHHLAAGTPAPEAMLAAATADDRRVADAAITGALVGAADGRRGLPPHWVLPVLTCRPDPELQVARPRPPDCWTDDLIELAEALLARAVARRPGG